LNIKGKIAMMIRSEKKTIPEILRILENLIFEAIVVFFLSGKYKLKNPVVKTGLFSIKFLVDKRKIVH